MLEELFLEMLCRLVVIYVNLTAAWKTYAILKPPNLGYLEGSCVCSLTVMIVYCKSSNDIISAAEHASDEPRLVSVCNTSFGTNTKTSQCPQIVQCLQYSIRPLFALGFMLLFESL